MAPLQRPPSRSGGQVHQRARSPLERSTCPTWVLLEAFVPETRRRYRPRRTSRSTAPRLILMPVHHSGDVTDGACTCMPSCVRVPYAPQQAVVTQPRSRAIPARSCTFIRFSISSSPQVRYAADRRSDIRVAPLVGRVRAVWRAESLASGASAVQRPVRFTNIRLRSAGSRRSVGYC